MKRIYNNFYGCLSFKNIGFSYNNFFLILGIRRDQSFQIRDRIFKDIHISSKILAFGTETGFDIIKVKSLKEFEISMKFVFIRIFLYLRF